MKRNTTLLLASLLLFSCGRVVDGTKDALNKGGELAGSAATEVIEGVTTGVENTWGVDVVLSDDLAARGLVVGKTQVESDSVGIDNKLVIYLATIHAFNDTVHAVAKDEDGREMGRSSIRVDLAEGMAEFHTFKFQSRTDLERKSTVEIR